MKIHYVTGNKGKFEEAKSILQPDFLARCGYELVHTLLHLTELQGTAQEIAHHKILQAYGLINECCLIDDVSIYCPALGDLPGPYIRPFLEALGDDGFAKLVQNYPDKSCKVLCSIGFARNPDHTEIFEGWINGTIVMPRGTRKGHAVSWNAIVVPDGETRTFAEMSLEEMSRKSARYVALTSFRNHLTALHKVP